MSKKPIGSPTRIDLTDWARVAAMSDDDIICDDENPVMTHEHLKDAVMKVGKQVIGRVGRPISENPKVSTTVRLSPEVIEYFKANGKGWQTRLDAVLREYVATH